VPLTAALAALAALLLSGCGAQPARTTATSVARAGSGIPQGLSKESRPIGRAPQFHPPARGAVLGPCRRELGPRRGVHVEVFAANRVVLVAAGLGVRPPIHYRDGRIAGAACYGEVVTLEPTGVVLVRPGARLSLADVFRSWGQALSRHQLASFPAGGEGVRVFVDGRPFTGSPGAVPLRRHAEIVLEVGPYVPPHRRYTFPPST
jgi:hypothetical protein